MRLLALGLTVCLLGLAILFSMVIRLVEPSLALSFLGYALALAGGFAAALGLASRLTSTRGRGSSELPPGN